VSRPRRSADLVITDLDNTLYDWVGFYVPSFLAMVDEIQRLSGVDLPSLIQGFRDVHKRHGTSEYAFALQELEPLRQLHPGATSAELLKRYDSAIHVFRRERQTRLRLYPTVKATLETLATHKVPVVALSDSGISYVSRRLRQLGIDHLLAAVSAPEDHGVPPTTPVDIVRRSRASQVMAQTEHLPFASQLRKPDPSTLDHVLRRFPVSRDRIVYVGDSLARDMLLARQAGLKDVWARYGRAKDMAQYERLVEISYWTAEDVAAERRLGELAATTPPANIIDIFSELLPIVLGADQVVAVASSQGRQTGRQPAADG
jgi:FMN phosphatase YigB (HAD superfamily)